MKPIVNVPNPVLRQISKSINQIDQKLIQFTKDLGETLINKTDPAGVGLSAVQVGLPIQLFLTYLPKDASLPTSKWSPKNQRLEVFINPKITYASEEITLGDKPDRPSLEGCLSIPKLYGPVWRHQLIEVEYLSFDLLNPPTNISQLINKKTSFSGFPARVVQHEYDHLQGILFTDYCLNQSPSPQFNRLGEVNNLYLEDGENLIPIANPKALIKW